jgi:hypothetical protein
LSLCLCCFKHMPLKVGCWEFNPESSAPRSTPESSAWRVWLLAPPPFSGAGSVFHSHLQCWC